MEEKCDLRKYIRDLKCRYTQEQLSEQSSTIIKRLTENRRFISSRTILLYYSLPDDVDTHRLIERISKTKEVLLPVVIDDTKMELRHFHDMTDMHKGAYDIMEPTGAIFEEYKKIDLAIVPGMAFDAKGHRLGRGKGYYDRFLKQLSNAYKIGVCFDFQKVETVPSCEHDVLMDEIL